MPNGANPSGIFGSLKPALNLNGLKWLANTSTVPQRKLVAYRKTAPPATPVASPLYTDPVAPVAQSLVELSTSNSAVAGMPRPRFHAEIVPSSVSKMKSAGLELGAFRANPNEVLATIPV